MAGIKTTDPGVQRHIKSTVSNLLNEVCDENFKSLFEMSPGIITLGSGVHCQFESTVSVSKRDGKFDEVLV